jgi:hypothetical protein
MPRPVLGVPAHPSGRCSDSWESAWARHPIGRPRERTVEALRSSEGIHLHHMLFADSQRLLQAPPGAVRWDVPGDTDGPVGASRSQRGPCPKPPTMSEAADYRAPVG